MAHYNNPFALLLGHEEGDIDVLIKNIETVAILDANKEKPKPLSDKSGRGLGERGRGRGNWRWRGYRGDSNGRGRFGGRGGRGQYFYENQWFGSNENYVGYNGKGFKEGGEVQQGVNFNERGRQNGFYENRGFGSNENYVGSGEGFKEGGEIPQDFNFVERRRWYGGENREFGWEETGYGGRGRGRYGKFRGGEIRRFNDGRYGGRNDRDEGLNRQGSQNFGTVDGKEEIANGDNAGTGREMTETTVVAKDAEVCKQSADQVISEDLSQKNRASRNNEQDPKNKEEEEKREKYEKRRKEFEEDAKKMTLAQYSKVLEDKRKALEANKVEERKVADGQEFEGMRLVESKKDKNEDIFIKLVSKNKLKKAGLDKEEKQKASLDKEEKQKAGLDKEEKLRKVSKKKLKKAGLDKEEKQKAGLDKEEKQKAGLDKEEKQKAGLDKEEKQKAGLDKEEKQKAGLGKEEKQKAGLGKEEKLRKSVQTLSINEFLNPSERQRYRSNGGGTRMEVHSAHPVRQHPVRIEDRTQFPQLGKVVEAAKA